jgi:16S rRNA (guanine527-N7)-methyltransferase
MMVSVEFEEELARVLPPDIPHRERLIKKSAQHLHMIVAANEQFNLTRITNPHEAAVKHVYDSVAPWRYFAGAKRVLDAGTGAGFPGVPLAVVLPETQFTLAESIQKKARFVDAAVDSLELPNVHVFSERAEQTLASRVPDIITCRAVAPMDRLLALFRSALKRGARLVLYKGPEVETELAEAEQHRVHAEVVSRYELPGGMGSRTLIEVRANKKN